MSYDSSTLLGPATDGCDSKEFNNLMIEATPYIEQGIANYLQKNPTAQMWASKIVMTEPFMDGKGLLMTKYVFHDTPAPQVPTSELFKPIGTSTAGSGSNPLDPDSVAEKNACTVECQSIGYGLQAKSWSVERACLNTAWMCAFDVQFNEQFGEVLDAQARNLARVSLGVQANWNRDKTISFSEIAGAFPDFVDSISPLNPRGVLPVTPPGGFCQANIGYFERLYDAFALQYPDAAIGSLNGMPLFGAIASRELIYSMRLNDPMLRELDKYGDPTFYRDGFNTTYVFHGWAFYFDAEAPRFDDDASRPGFIKRVWPYVATNTTIGQRYDALPGGPYDKAPYEMCILLFRDQFTNVPFRINSRPGGQVAFKDVDFTGQVKWQQIPDCEDEDGLTGRYRMQFARGAKPGTHDAGFAFIFRRPGNDKLRLLCENGGVCSPCDATQPTVPSEHNIGAGFACASVDGYTDRLQISGNDLRIGDPSDGDTVYVRFVDGSVLAAEVISFTAGTPDVGVFEFAVDVTCDTGGGVYDLSTSAPAIAVECREAGVVSGNDRIAVVVIGGDFEVPAVNTSFTVTFGDGTTDAATYEGTAERDGETLYFFEFSGNQGIGSDCTSRGGAVTIALA